MNALSKVFVITLSLIAAGCMGESGVGNINAPVAEGKWDGHAFLDKNQWDAEIAAGRVTTSSDEGNRDYFYWPGENVTIYLAYGIQVDEIGDTIRVPRSINFVNNKGFRLARLPGGWRPDESYEFFWD